MDPMDEDLEREGRIPSRQSHHAEDDDSDFMIREATEVHILMSHKFRISRTRRMNWYLDFHDSFIKLTEPEPRLLKPFQVTGVELKDGDKLSVDEEFKIISNTCCLFYSKFYRMSFVLDLSPTAFAADSVGNIIYTNMLPSVFKLLEEIVTPFVFPNSSFKHKVEVYVTLFAYCPYLNFTKPPVLVHGFRVNESTLKNFIEFAEVNTKEFINSLLEFMEPINARRDKVHRQINLIERQVSVFNFNKNDENPEDETEENVENELIEMVPIDFRLLQMLRLAMLGLFNGPENSQPAVFIVTDGVLYIPDTEVIQSIAVNLKTSCVPLFFVQITAVNHGPSLGFVPSDELLCFLSEVSFGKRLKHPEILNFHRTDNKVSFLQKTTLAWSCQRPPFEMEPALDVMRDNTNRIKKHESKIKSNFYSLFHVRVREGYSLLNLNITKKGRRDFIVANFRLPWTVDCKIDYQISADYEQCDNRIHEIQRIVTIETNYTPPENITDETDSAFTAGLFLTESERFALKVLNFNAQPEHYEVQKQALSRYPGLYGFTKDSYPFPTLLNKSLENSKFNAFWQPLLVADNAALHRCSHTIPLRFIIQYCRNPKPNTDYWALRQQPENFGFFPMKKPVLQAIYDYFKKNTTFCLVAKYSYVKIVREGMAPPNYCYMVKIFADSTLLTIKVIFIGDCSLDIRTKTISKMKTDLINLENFPRILLPVGIGVDAKLLKYRQMVHELDVVQPVHLAPAKEIWETRQNIHHGTLVKFLVPKRMIWRIEKGLADTRFDKVAVEAMNILVRRRILEGFKIVFEENGIINMIKEIPSNSLVPQRYEQYIIFPASKNQMQVRGSAVQQLREQLAAVGQKLELYHVKKLKDSKIENKSDQELTRQKDTVDQKLIEIRKEVEAKIVIPDVNTPGSGTETPDSVIKVLTSGTPEEITTPKMTGPDSKGSNESKRLRKPKQKKEEETPPPVVEEQIEEPLPEEVYKEFGTFIVTEFWTEPTTLIADESGYEKRFPQAKDDKAVLCALMTFRTMQAELDRAPGLGTALVGNEPYVMHNYDCSPIKLAKGVDFYPFLHNLVKLCFCGERTLVLMPTLKFVRTDPHSNDRLGRILDSFNHELRNYMPQSFEFEDTDNAWGTLAAGYESVLQEVNENERLEAERLSLYESETDVEKVADEIDDSPGTGYSSPGCTSLPSQPTGTRSLSNQMASMGMVELTKSVLSGFDARMGSGSGDSSCSPKASTSTPALLSVDEDDHAEFLPTKKKTCETPNPANNAAVRNDSDRESKSKKTKKKKKKGKDETSAAMVGSTLSLASSSEKSKKRSKSTASNQAPLVFSVYYKRRDPKTIIVVIVPSTCRAVLNITNKLVPKLPVLCFMIEEDRMLEIFRNSQSLPKEFRKNNLENFCVSRTLAYLYWQVNAKISESEREPPSQSGLFNFESIEGADPTFSDLNGFIVNIMHDLLFSRAYAQAAYHCLGTNIHVPQVVLEEVLEERCNQTSVLIGSIKDVLRVTCTHLSSYLQSKRVSRYKRHQIPNNSSSSSSESELDLQQINEYQIMNPFCYSEAENDEICRMEREEFRIAFENVLRQHKFFKIPNFDDYYFYWPSGDNTVNLFNTGATWNTRDEDDETQPSTLSDSSAVTVLSEDGSRYGIDSDDVNLDVEPLFIQFYVNIPQADYYSYPVDFIPNCLKEVLSRCDNTVIGEEDKTFDNIDIKIEMYVLTVPSMDSIDPKQSEEKEKVELDDFMDWMSNKEEDFRDDVDLFYPEKKIILDLEKGIRHMLEMEKILILSRYFDQQRSYKNIDRVVQFVEEESKRTDEHTRVQMAQSDMLFVTQPKEGLKRLCSKLENALISYCKIKSVKDEKAKIIVFYCCSVENLDVFCSEHKLESDEIKPDFKPQKRQRIHGEADDDEGSTTVTEDLTEASTLKQPEESSIVLEDDDEVMDINLPLHEDRSLGQLDEKVKRKQIIHDFWLLAKIEADPVKIKTFFFQRPNGYHDSLFKKFTDRLVEEIKNVNRTLLLEEMHDTKESSPYLIEDEEISKDVKNLNYPILDHLSLYARKFVVLPSNVNKSSRTLHGSVSSTESAVPDPQPRDNLEPIRDMYSSGYFFCNLVWKHWFEINPRLRQKNLDLGWIALKSGLENLAVKNRKNVYVFKEQDGNVVYIYLFSDPEIAIKTIKNIDSALKNEIKNEMNKNILFAVFGIKEPGKEVTINLINMLQKKLDGKVMEELQKALLKNPQLTMNEADISFIQPNVQNPAAKFYFSLPLVVSDYLASVFTYLQQHLSIHYIRPKFFDDKCAKFKPYPIDGVYEISKDYEGFLFLVNKPKAEGQRSTGIGCFEVRLIDKTGRMVPSERMLSGKLNADSFSLLYPGFSGNSKKQKTAKFQELTKSVQLESLKVQSASINSSYFIEALVWQAGDIHLEELQTKLRIICQQALADLVIEFGLMAQPFLEPIPIPMANPSPPGVFNRPTSLTRQSTIDQKSTLKKRGSTVTSEGATPSSSNVTLIPHPPLGMVSPNASILSPSLISIESPKPPTPGPQSPKHVFTKFAFEATTPLASFYSDVSSLGPNKIQWKSSIDKDLTFSNTTCNATEVPNLSSGPSEQLRLDFIPSTAAFFYYIERESRSYPDMAKSFQKFSFILDCQQTSDTILRVIYAKLVECFKSSNDSVSIVKPFINKEGSKRLQTLIETDSLSCSSVNHDRGYIAEYDDNYTDINYAIIVYNKQQMIYSIKQSLKLKGESISPELIALGTSPNESHFNFGPGLSPFVPRRRFFFLVNKGESLSLFFYNVEMETTCRVKDIVEKAVFWNNTRNRLLREIGLHKMQISHLSPLKSKELYHSLIWKDPELLISRDFPPDEIKPSDFTKMPKQFTRTFLKMYRYFDPIFVPKNISPQKFDDQTAQILAMRKDIRQDLNDFNLFKHVHKEFLIAKDREVQLDEDVLNQFLSRCEEAHYVQTPLLLFPEWRSKVAVIRGVGSDFGSVRKRKQSAPSKSINNKKHSMEPKMKPRSKTMTDAVLPPRPTSSEEPCSLKIQYMLAKEYVHYLEKYLGMRLIQVKSSQQNSDSLNYSTSINSAPIVWLQTAHPGGVLLINLFFSEPYFCLRLLFWSRGILTDEQNVSEIRNFIKSKNLIAAKCHLHSFTYDFHLRMVSTYLVGGTQLLFNRGYNTSAFLIDFLQYYSCRPPSARNCLFEEDCLFENLKVPGIHIWENFLNNESKYGWKVVRLKTLDKEGTDEFMLVSIVHKDLLDQEYKGIRLITNVSNAKGVGSKEPKLAIRYYVMMVSCKEGKFYFDNPLLDTPVPYAQDTVDGGEFIKKDQSSIIQTEQEGNLYSDEDDTFDFGFGLEGIYDSDARHSSGSNSDRSQRAAAVYKKTGRQSTHSVASVMSMTQSGGRLSDIESTLKDYLSPCPSPMSHTLVEQSLKTPVASVANLDPNELRNKLRNPVIQKVPPRGHRKHASISNDLKLKGAIPPEQVTYVHYFNNLQKSLQTELEEFGKVSKIELSQLVAKADMQCHVEMLWKKLLSSDSITKRKTQMTVFQQLGSKLDIIDANQLLKQVMSTDLNKEEWETFLSIIKVINMQTEEARLEQIFAGQTYLSMFKFFVLHFDGEKRCRFFDFPDSKNLVITNPSCLDSATLFTYKVQENKMNMFMLFKERDFSGPQSDPFSRNAIHKQFEDIMQCLSAYIWADLMGKKLTFH